MTDRVLVTGATGYLGSTLIDKLIDTDEHITILTKPDNPIAPRSELRSAVDTITGDITDHLPREACSCRRFLSTTKTHANRQGLNR